jgi:hypothetical protein
MRLSQSGHSTSSSQEREDLKTITGSGPNENSLGLRQQPKRTRLSVQPHPTYLNGQCLQMKRAIIL